MYQQYTPAPAPKSKWKPWHKITLAVIGGLILLLCCGGILVSAFPDTKAGDAPDEIGTVFPTTPATATTRPTTKAAAVLTKADIKLAVKVTKKSCFGSAGCNVEFQIDATVTKPFDDDYTVTYDVRGLDDVQTSQLTIHPDGTFEQDRFAFGSTSSSSKKLTATVTDLEKA